MPAYDFKCPDGHITEHFMSYSALQECGGKISCTEMVYNDEQRGMFECGKEGEYSASFWYSSGVHFAQRFSPVVIHRGIDGKLRFPAHANAPVPDGFQRVELTDVSQIRALEREVNTRDRETDMRFQDARNKFLDGQLACNREAVATQVAGFSQRGKWFYDSIRRVSEKKRLAGRSAAKPEFFVEAFTQNSSNREEYNNGRGGSMRGNGK